MPAPVDQQIARFLSHGVALNQRRTLLLSGDREWGREQLILLFPHLFSLAEASATRTELPKNSFEPISLAALDSSAAISGAYKEVVWLGDAPMPGANKLQRSHHSPLLGIDTDCVIFDCWSGFDPDSFGQVAGTLRGGGCLILLAPPLDEWPGFDDPDHRRYRALRPLAYSMRGAFLHRAITLFRRAAQTEECGLAILIQSGSSILLSMAENSPAPIQPAARADTIDRSPLLSQGEPYRASVDQQNFIDATMDLFARKLISGHSGRTESTAALRNSVVVLLKADRGRGKSVALGLLATELLRSFPGDVLVTSPSRVHAARLMEVGKQSGHDASRLRFCAADALLTQKPHCAVLLVDEAAAFPLPVLQRLLERYSLIVFSTTTNGYEGSGRGFEMRFGGLLQRSACELAEMSLTKPLRWSENDGLEIFSRRLLLLDSLLETESHSSCKLAVEAAGYRLRKLQSSELLDSEDLLRQVFGLLVQAHYQTRPSDLRFLLDAPYSHIWVMECAQQNRIAGVLLACEEGGLAEPLAGDVARGQRRPQGNMLAQALALLSAEPGWCTSNAIRVMRIAVRPDCRRRGLASSMIEGVESYAIEQGMDYFGSSFGYQAELQRFWQAMGMEAVYVGLRLDKASAARNVMVVKALTAPAVERQIRLAARLARDLPLWRPAFMPELTVSDLSQIVSAPGQKGVANNPDQESALDIEVLRRFCDAEISFEMAYPSLRRWIDPKRGDPLYRVLECALDLAPNWVEIAHQLALPGRRAIVAAIRADLSARADLSR